MDAQKVDMFIVTNGKFFRPEIVPQLREKLLSLDESKWVMLQTIQFKDPTISLIISLLGGSLRSRRRYRCRGASYERHPHPSYYY